MKRARNGNSITGIAEPHRSTAAAAAAAATPISAAGRERTRGCWGRGGRLAMVGTAALWCGAAPSTAPVVAAASGVRSGRCSTRTSAFLHCLLPARHRLSPRLALAGVVAARGRGRAVGRAMAGGGTAAGGLPEAGRAGLLPLGTSRHWHHVPKAGAAASTTSGFSISAAGPGNRLPSSTLQRSPMVFMSMAPGCPGRPGSSALGTVCNSAGIRSSTGSKAFFGSGSSSRTASRRRRDRRQTIRAGKIEASRSRSRTETPKGELDGEQQGGQEGRESVAERDAATAAAGEAGGSEPASEEQEEEPPGDLPFGTAYHVPVVCKEVLEWLVTDPDGVYVDCTLGGGGHSAALLSALGGGARVIGLDRDPDALREASRRLAAEAESGRFQAVRSNFADVGQAVRDCDLLSPQEPLGASSLPPTPSSTAEPSSVPSTVDPSVAAAGDSASSAAPIPPSPFLVDGILVDLGVSSHQIDDGARGFSFSADGPLDMRMEGGGGGGEGEASRSAGPAGGVEGATGDQAVVEEGRLSGSGGRRSAADVVNFADEMEIREMVWRYGDEKRSTKIARAIVENRPFETTGKLAEVVGKCAPPKDRVKTLARVFQALRIEVNGELDALEALLEQAKHLIRPGGRLLILSYHSLEDRRVKRVLASGNLKGKVEKDFYGNLLSPWKPLLRKPLMAGEAEIALNPRARSVRLRVAERTALGAAPVSGAACGGAAGTTAA